MGLFDDLRHRAKAAALASISEMEGGDWPYPDFTAADSSVQAIGGVMPEAVDAEWCSKVASERPELWNVEPDGDTMAAAMRQAVCDLIFNDIAEELEEHAKSIGLAVGNDESPTP